MLLQCSLVGWVFCHCAWVTIVNICITKRHRCQSLFAIYLTSLFVIIRTLRLQNFFIPIIIKFSARKSDEMAIGKMHPTLLSDQYRNYVKIYFLVGKNTVSKKNETTRMNKIETIFKIFFSMTCTEMFTKKSLWRLMIAFICFQRWFWLQRFHLDVFLYCTILSIWSVIE